MASDELPVAVTALSDGTLNILCDVVPVQFLSVEGQTQLSPTVKVDTANVAATPDILAMKLNAIIGRAKLRDYFDLMVIDQQTNYPVEIGIQLFFERFHPQVPEQSAMNIVRSLAYFDDVEDDATIPVDRDIVVQFWKTRSIKVARHLDRNGVFVTRHPLGD
ncbi:MAG: hypothetical protein ACYDGY_08525 [Acidimicrobiales bacterium]